MEIYYNAEYGICQAITGTLTTRVDGATGATGGIRDKDCAQLVSEGCECHFADSTSSRGVETGSRGFMLRHVHLSVVHQPREQDAISWGLSHLAA